MTTLVPEPEAESVKSGNTRFKMNLEGHTLQTSHYRDGNTEFLKGSQTDRGEFGEVSGHRVLIKRGPGSWGPTECGTTHEATSGMSS